MGRVIVAILCLTGAAHAQITVPCVDEQTREQVRALVMEGLDQALSNYMTKVFDVWMRDVHESPPRRATLGLNLAINSYIRARAAVLAWNPPLCP
jgi:hypothetical protein